MKTFTIDVPAMYGDHHVQEVRRILLSLPGVTDVYASSSFQVVEITYEPTQIEETVFEEKLKEAGYTGELEIPVESGVSAYNQEGISQFIRHTATYETTRHSISFGQTAGYSGRPLWNCPGLGILNNKMED